MPVLNNLAIKPLPYPPLGFVYSDHATGPRLSFIPLVNRLSTPRNSSKFLARETMPIQPFFSRARSCDPTLDSDDDSIDVVTCTHFSAPFLRGSSCPVVSTRAEYNHDVGRTTELDLEVTQHHRPKDKFDLKFDEVMKDKFDFKFDEVMRQTHPTKASRYSHSRPTCFLPAQAAAAEADRSRNAFFDGALPPFSNIGNTERGTTPDAPTLHDIGVKANFSTANPTSAIDTGDAFDGGEEPHH